MYERVYIYIIYIHIFVHIYIYIHISMYIYRCIYIYMGHGTIKFTCPFDATLLSFVHISKPPPNRQCFGFIAPRIPTGRDWVLIYDIPTCTCTHRHTYFYIYMYTCMYVYTQMSAYPHV